MPFQQGSPFTPFQHLLCCLPPRSAACLPPSYSDLLTSPSSPLAAFYPSEFCQDLNGKTKSYEAVIITPFIAEEDVLAAIHQTNANDLLTEEEILRNTIEPEYMFTFTPTAFEYLSPLSSVYFPSISSCHAKRDCIQEGYSVVLDHLAQTAVPSNRTALFPSLSPCCKNIRHTIPTSLRLVSSTPAHASRKTEAEGRSGRPKRYLVEEVSNTIVELDEAFVPYVTTESYMQSIGQKYLNHCVHYDYPRHKIGLVVGLLSYHYRYSNNRDGKGVVSKLSEKERAMVKEKLDTMNTIAMKGDEHDPHDIGNIDLHGNSLLLQILPVYCVQRLQQSGKVVPFFSKQAIEYPFILARLVPETQLNFLCGAHSLTTHHFQEALHVGDEVIYIGKAHVKSKSLQGTLGVLTAIKDNMLTVRLSIPTYERVVDFHEQKWYTFEELRSRVPSEYHSLFASCMKSLFVKDKVTHEAIYIGLNLSPGRGHIGREALVRINPEFSAISVNSLPAHYFSMLALDVENTNNDGNHPSIGDSSRSNKDSKKRNELGEKEQKGFANQHEEYSQRACDLVCEYFRRFGPVLKKGISFKDRERVINQSVLEVGFLYHHTCIYSH